MTNEDDVWIAEAVEVMKRTSGFIGRGQEQGMCQWKPWADLHRDLESTLARAPMPGSAEGDGWIAVTERLPDVAGERGCSRIVLVHGTNGFIYPRRYWKAHGGFGKVKATHWREMPAPPSLQDGASNQ